MAIRVNMRIYVGLALISVSYGAKHKTYIYILKKSNITTIYDGFKNSHNINICNWTWHVCSNFSIYHMDVFCSPLSLAVKLGL